jgi:hypothetical protein
MGTSLGLERIPRICFGRAVITASIATIDTTLRPAPALANGTDAEPVTGPRERRLGSLA